MFGYIVDFQEVADKSLSWKKMTSSPQIPEVNGGTSPYISYILGTDNSLPPNTFAPG
jgi:hypothetical protein